jgi:5-oxoprolinase (ATP-hydrolysing)
VRPVHAHESLVDVIIGSNGQKYFVDEKLNTEHIRFELTQLKAAGKITSIAIVLMHSYAFDEHELKVASIAREVGFTQISVSSQIMKRVKLVKRGQTCCVDAYLNPHIHRYL